MRRRKSRRRPPLTVLKLRRGHFRGSKTQRGPEEQLLTAAHPSCCQPVWARRRRPAPLAARRPPQLPPRRRPLLPPLRTSSQRALSAAPRRELRAARWHPPRPAPRPLPPLPPPQGRRRRKCSVGAGRVGGCRVAASRSARCGRKVDGERTPCSGPGGAAVRLQTPRSSPRSSLLWVRLLAGWRRRRGEPPAERGLARTQLGAKLGGGAAAGRERSWGAASHSDSTGPPCHGASGGGCVGSGESDRGHVVEALAAGRACRHLLHARCALWREPALCGLSVPAPPGAVRAGVGLWARCRNRLLAERVDNRERGSLKSWQNFFTLKGQRLLQ